MTVTSTAIRGWGTWTPERPAELSDPTNGWTVTPVLYSDRIGCATAIPPGDGITYGPRDLDGSSIAFETEHGGTRLAWRYDLGNPDAVAIEWQRLAEGEWGLRFWVALCLAGPEDAPLPVACAKKPLLVTRHADLDAVCREYDEKGYFYLDSRDAEGPLVALRFNLEEAPGMRIEIGRGVASSPALPVPAPRQDTEPEVTPQASLQAIHDVIDWNHVHDRVNDRPYTIATRAWNSRKFGGFGLWMTDTLYHALLWAPFDPVRARHNVEALFAWQTEAGNFPCLITGNDRWVDRSQPPVASFAVWCINEAAGNDELLHWAFPALLRNHDWWWERRVLADSGLVAYGTSPEAGRGLYKGTKLAAKNESSNDNMPLHDQAPFDPETGLLQSADVGLNSLLALDGEILSLMAARLGLEAERERLAQRSERHKARIAEWLWDAERGVFANRLLDGGFVESLAPTSFFPMAAGIATPEQCESMIAGYLTAPEKFGGELGLPSCTRDDPAYPDNVYWRGRIWGPLNFWAYQGLRRCGRDAEATALAARSAKLFHRSWRDRLCGENYNPDSGAITDQADSDSFYAWGALLPLLDVCEIADSTPWAGSSLAPSLVAGTFGPVLTPLGRLEIGRRDDGWQISRSGEALLAGDLEGRLLDVTLSREGFSAILPAGPPCRLSFPERPIAEAALADDSVEAGKDFLWLPERPDPARLTVRFT